MHIYRQYIEIEFDETQNLIQSKTRTLRDETL